MDDARLEPAPLHALLELAVAAGVDDDDRVEVGGRDLVEVAVEDARAVVRPQDRVGAGRTAARRRARELDVLAEALDHRAGLAPDAEAVAQVARVLQVDARARAPLPRPVVRLRPTRFGRARTAAFARLARRALAAGAVRARPLARAARPVERPRLAARLARLRRPRAGEPLRELLHALGPEHGREVRRAAARRRHDRPGQRLAELAGERPAALELAVVGVQRAAAALRRRRRQLGDEPLRRPAHARVHRALEAPEHEARPLALAPGALRPRAPARVAPGQPHEPDAPAPVDRPQQRAQLQRPPPPA